ncbi:MAG: DUF1223 domain-containing protein [Pseudomonadota bacterium]
MRISLAAAFATLLIATGAPALADRLVVVELFTSQGCSSCPPADQLLGELSRQEGVLPLALHVDYWDYIGWKDEFAKPEHTARQKAYAAVAQSRTIYTPQMVVDGQDHVVGFKPGRLMKLLMQHSSSVPKATATVQREGADVVVSVTATGAPGEAEIVLVRYLSERMVDIRRGENAGHTYAYHNIVADMRQIGTWDGQGTHSLRTNAEGEGEFAVLVQSPGAGPILAAARVP